MRHADFGEVELATDELDPPGLDTHDLVEARGGGVATLEHAVGKYQRTVVRGVGDLHALGLIAGHVDTSDGGFLLAVKDD